MTEQDQKIEAQIAKIQAQHQAAAAKEIADYKLSFEVENAREDIELQHNSELVTLSLKHKNEIKELAEQQKVDTKAFEVKYNVDFKTLSFAYQNDKYYMTTTRKCEEVELLKDKNKKLKYTLNSSNEIVGTKGEVITSTIILPLSPAGKKRTLAVNAFKSYMISQKK